MPTVELEILANASDADRDAILQPLIAYNRAKVGPSNYEPLAIMLRDDTRTCVGGLWGRLHYDWLFIELLFVPEQLRGEGLGSRLLFRAEDFAREKGGVGVWLDTHGFQAPHFYQKQGYERFGSLDDYPRGFDRIFFRKYLSQSA